MQIYILNDDVKKLLRDRNIEFLGFEDDIDPELALFKYKNYGIGSLVWREHSKLPNKKILFLTAAPLKYNSNGKFVGVNIDKFIEVRKQISIDCTIKDRKIIETLAVTEFLNAIDAVI